MPYDTELEKLWDALHALQREVDGLKRRASKGNGKGQAFDQEEMLVALAANLSALRKHHETRTAAAWAQWSQVRGFPFRNVAAWLDENDAGWRDRGLVLIPLADKSKLTEFTINKEALHGGNRGQPTPDDP